jgi:hypothetical protein
MSRIPLPRRVCLGHHRLQVRQVVQIPRVDVLRPVPHTGATGSRLFQEIGNRIVLYPQLASRGYMSSYLTVLPPIGSSGVRHVIPQTSAVFWLSARPPSSVPLQLNPTSRTGTSAVVDQRIRPRRVQRPRRPCRRMRRSRHDQSHKDHTHGRDQCAQHPPCRSQNRRHGSPGRADPDECPTPDAARRHCLATEFLASSVGGSAGRSARPAARGGSPSASGLPR